MFNNYESAIKAWQQCLIDCQNCLTQMAGKESSNQCPYCCMICIDACLVCVKSIVAQSPFTKKYCRLCAEVCEWCAQQCREHDNEHCQACFIT